MIRLTESLDRTLESHFRVLYERQRLRGCSPSTRRQYRINIDHFGEYLGRPATVDDLTDDAVAACMAWFVETRRAPRTANKFRDNMLALWRFLARKHVVDQWADVPPLAEPHRIPVAWTKEQLSRLYGTLDGLTGEIGGVSRRLWWHALHALCWDTAERISAVLSTEWGQVDLAGGWIVVKAEWRKGRRADVLSKLHPDTVHCLTLMREPERPRVLPWPWSKTYVWNRYKRILKAAGLPDDREHKFHCLRKSAASYFEAAGHDATRLLGHSSRRVTARYLDPRIVGQTHAADVLFRPAPRPD